MDVAGSDAVKHYPAIVLNVGQDSSINRVSSFDYERFFFLLKLKWKYEKRIPINALFFFLSSSHQLNLKKLNEKW